MASEPSETGPSADGIDLAATAEEIAAIFVTSGPARTVAASRVFIPLGQLVVRVIAEAKRSAHLEDARAVEALIADFEVEVARMTVGKDGVIRSSNLRHQTRTLRRKVREVWDALSLLPGGQK